MKSSTWTLFVVLLVLFHDAYSWNIGAKGRVNGPSIHTTYFLTPNNQLVKVHGQAYPGTYVNGNCQYAAQVNLGDMVLQTGNVVDIDGFLLKSVVGGGYSCITIFYTYRQLVMETFQLIWDGSNYDTSAPATSNVTIL